MKKLLKRIYIYIGRKFYPEKRERLVRGINRDFNNVNQKKVLLTYLDLNMSSKLLDGEEKFRSGSRHTNLFELYQIIQCFIKLGFCIDVCAHNDIEAKYYKHLNKPIRRIFQTSFGNNKSCLINNRVCDKYLVFGTDGFVHKGIDLLIEVFRKHKEWELYLCGSNITNKMDEYGYKQYENIYDCGYISVESENFTELVEQCTYILLPSCSECMSTGVLTGMRHGLIPVVSKGNGFDDFSEYCYFFEGYHLDEIEATIKSLEELLEEDIKKKAVIVKEFAEREFTLEKFESNMYHALEEIFYEAKL